MGCPVVVVATPATCYRVNVATPATQHQQDRNMNAPFHEWLRGRIKEVGLSGPSALATTMSAEAAPIDRRTAWRWCAGRRVPGRESWPALAEALEVPLDQLALRVVGVEPVAPPVEVDHG